VKRRAEGTFHDALEETAPLFVSRNRGAARCADRLEADRAAHRFFSEQGFSVRQSGDNTGKR